MRLVFSFVRLMATQTENEAETETSYLLAQTFYIDLARFFLQYYCLF